MGKAICWWCDRRVSPLEYVRGKDNNVCDECWVKTPAKGCATCNETGLIDGKRCETCRGIGRVKE